MSEVNFDTASLEKPQLTLGFIPLTDCAPLVIAKEKGFFARYSLDVTLSKETSWANLRDKLSVGILDGAQTLASLPLAMSAGVSPIEKPMLAPLTLDLNGNAITVSESLYQQLRAVDPQSLREAPVSARALRKLIDKQQAEGAEPLTFAVVFPTSTHNYELRYWMAAAGIDPDKDVRLVVVPPPQMVGALRDGEIDGYCVGEPWNSMAVREGLGRVLITKYELWNNGPEKVFGVSEEWAAQNPNTLQALLMALLEACRWVDQPQHRQEVAEIISRPVYVNAPEEVVRMSMLGTFQYARNEFPRSLPDFNVFHHSAANFPWVSHALWLGTQMARWGQLKQATDLRKLAARVYRPDLYRKAADALGIASPSLDCKTEGVHAECWQLDGQRMGPDRFFDGRVFDPRDPIAYLNSFHIAHLADTPQAWADNNPAVEPVPEGAATRG